MNPVVSIIVVLFNSRKWLPRLCESLKTQTIAPDLEILFIDSGSADDSLAFAKQLVPEARGIDAEQNSFTNANNLGVREARGTYVMLVNPDMWLEPTCAETLLLEMEQLPHAGATVPRILSYRPDEAGRYVFDTTGFELLPKGLVVDRGQGELDNGQHAKKEKVFGLSGACGLFRREALNAIAWNGELFDNHFRMYQEDVDLSFRLAQSPWEVWYIPQAVAHHNRTVSQTEHETPQSRHAHRPSYANAYSYRNHLLILCAHIRWPFLRRHGLRLLGYETAKAGYILFREPKTVGLVLKSGPKFRDAWRKRKHFATLQTAEPNAILTWVKKI